MGRRHKQTFLQRRHPNGQQTHEKMLKIISHKEIQIKTPLRYHLTPVRMAKIDKARNNRCWRGCGERRTLLHCWWECKLVQPLWKQCGGQKVKIELPYDTAIALLGIYPKDTDIMKRRAICTPNVHSSIVHNS